jgi:hypothetical protein
MAIGPTTLTARGIATAGIGDLIAIVTGTATGIGIAATGLSAATPAIRVTSANEIAVPK